MPIIIKAPGTSISLSTKKKENENVERDRKKENEYEGLYTNKLHLKIYSIETQFLHYAASTEGI